MPLSETAATAVTERFQARLADIANRASTVSLRAWEQLGAWDRVDIDRFAAATADSEWNAFIRPWLQWSLLESYDFDATGKFLFADLQA